MSILEKYMCVFTCVLEYAPPKQRITLIKCSNDEFSLSSFQNFAKKEKKQARKLIFHFENGNLQWKEVLNPMDQMERTEKLGAQSE